MSRPSDAPALSVVVASYRTGPTIERCLASLEAQDLDGMETIVVESSGDGTAERVAERFPRVVLVAFPERKHPGSARNAGVAVARAGVVAFLTGDCVVGPGWARAVVDAHREPAPIVGGPVDNAGKGSYVGWGAYFLEFSRYLPGGATRTVDDIPACCLSVKREALDRLGPFAEGSLCSDTAFNWRSGAEGAPPLFVPSVGVGRDLSTGLGRYLASKFEYGVSFVRVVVGERRPSRATMLAHVAATPVMPLLLFARRMRLVFAARRYRARFLLASPVTLAGLAAWSAGEAVGYARALQSTAASRPPASESHDAV